MEQPQITGIPAAVGTAPFDAIGNMALPTLGKKFGQYKGVISSSSGYKLLTDLIPGIGVVQEVIIQHIYNTPLIRVGTVGVPLINQDMATVQVAQSLVGQQGWVTPLNATGGGTVLTRQVSILDGLVSAWVSLPASGAASPDAYVAKILPQVTTDGTPYYFRWRIHPTSLAPAINQYYWTWPLRMAGTVPDINDTLPWSIGIDTTAGGTLWVDDNATVFPALNNAGAIALDVDHVIEVYVTAAGVLQVSLDNALVFTGNRKVAAPSFDAINFGWTFGAANPAVANACGWDFFFSAAGDVKTAGMAIFNGTSIRLDSFNTPTPASQIAIAAINATAPDPQVEILVVGA